MNDEREYRVISPIKVAGRIIKSGPVTLPAAVAARFLAMVDCPIADPHNPPGESKDDGKARPQDGAGDQGGVTLAQIVEAIGQLTPGDENHWTKGNLPETKALASILGKPVRAADRDEAWKAWQARQSG